MLQPITKKWIDLSTDKSFQFAFCCDRCGYEFVSTKYEFLHNFPSPLLEGQKEAKDIMWRTSHALAFERANLEVAVYFNECVSCGDFVCANCYGQKGAEQCLQCESKKTKRRTKK